MTIRALAWGLAHRQRWAVVDILRHFHIPFPFQWSPYYRDFKRFYSGLDVQDKFVLDIGSDYGTTPLCFLNKGAICVFGYSMDEQVFSHPDYVHIKGVASGQAIMSMNGGYNGCLKSDAEGIEWDLTEDFIDSFEDWIICLHAPVRNKELHRWIVRNGRYIGRQGKCEFAIYQKRKSNENNGHNSGIQA